MEDAGGVVVFVVFMVVWSALFFGTFGGMVLGVIALISAARTPTEGFGPWWDNTKTAWLLGIAISYLIPFGMVVTGVYWFRTGKRGLAETGVVGRPFWIGPPKPYPPSLPMWGPYPPGQATSPGPGWGPPGQGWGPSGTATAWPPAAPAAMPEGDPADPAEPSDHLSPGSD